MPSYRLVGESLPRRAGADDVTLSEDSSREEDRDRHASEEQGARVPPSAPLVEPALAAHGAAGAGEGEPAARSPEEYLETRRRMRSEAIDRLVEEARRQGHFASRTFWSMVYDFERAPRTTNRAQLAGLGIDVPRSAELSDDEVTIQLWAIIEGLGRLGAYLSHTNHLSDRELYEILEERILNEEVPDIVGGEGMQEWIDLLSEGDFDRYEPSADGGAPPPPMPSDRDARLPRPEQGGHCSAG